MTLMQVAVVLAVPASLLLFAVLGIWAVRWARRNRAAAATLAAAGVASESTGGGPLLTGWEAFTSWLGDALDGSWSSFQTWLGDWVDSISDSEAGSSAGGDGHWDSTDFGGVGGGGDGE